MNLALLATDNITELLVKIIEFTQRRQRILIQNINNVRSPGFVPKDLAVNEFSCVLNNAINEHTRSKRLLFCDTKNIKFGDACRLETLPTRDKYAEELLEKNRNEYIELQINKLLENSLNQRAAAVLLKQKQEMISIFE
jgi:flagellar basal body rod protein FlgB